MDRRKEELEPDTWVSWSEVLALESLEVVDYSTWYLSSLPTLFPVKKLTLRGLDTDSAVTFMKSCATTLEYLSLGLSNYTTGMAEGVFQVYLQLGRPA